MLTLREFLLLLDDAGKDAFAKRADTTLNMLEQVAYGGKRPAEGWCMRLERAAFGVVTCESLRPDIDWASFRAPARSLDLVAQFYSLKRPIPAAAVPAPSLLSH